MATTWFAHIIAEDCRRRRVTMPPDPLLPKLIQHRRYTDKKTGFCQAQIASGDQHPRQRSPGELACSQRCLLAYRVLHTARGGSHDSQLIYQNRLFAAPKRDRSLAKLKDSHWGMGELGVSPSVSYCGAITPTRKRFIFGSRKSRDELIFCTPLRLPLTRSGQHVISDKMHAEARVTSPSQDTATTPYLIRDSASHPS